MKEIPLTQGKVALVDDTDFDWLNQWKWCAWTPNGKYFYAKRGQIINGKDVQTFMHVLVSGIKEVDHIDRNGLNNQRFNLRASTKSQNGFNRGPNRTNKAGLKGVSWHNRDLVYRARIHINGKEIHLGFFHNPFDAARAFDAAAIRLHGEFSCTNQTLGLLTQ